jgi:hypothetical protein
MAPDELATTFWNGVNLDYSELQTRANRVKAALAGAAMKSTSPTRAARTSNSA